MKLLLILLALALLEPVAKAKPQTVEVVEPVAVIETLETSEPAETVVHKPVEHVITAYCPCSICCGEWALKRNGVVEVNGIILEAGVSVAAPYPAGTILDIEGIGERVVHDSTADYIVERYNGKIVDLYFATHDEALRFGKHTRNVTIVSRGDSKR